MYRDGCALRPTPAGVYGGSGSLAAARQTRCHGKLNGEAVSTLGGDLTTWAAKRSSSYLRSDRLRRDSAITSNHFSYTRFDMMIINGSCIVAVPGSVTSATGGGC